MVRGVVAHSQVWRMALPIRISVQPATCGGIIVMQLKAVTAILLRLVLGKLPLVNIELTSPAAAD
jgi:hypothetical protein